jgi:hypothetical protein
MYCYAVYELSSEGLDGKEHFFRKPWFMTFIMFLGMSFCLPLAYWEENAKMKSNARAADTGNGTDEPLLQIHEEV